jgi:hypothetical protein
MEAHTTAMPRLASARAPMTTRLVPTAAARFASSGATTRMNGRPSANCSSARVTAAFGSPASAAGVSRP